jgi:hypothetical protein
MERAMFKPGDEANAIAQNGQEVLVKVMGVTQSGDYLVAVIDETGMVDGPSQTVRKSRLLRLRGPYFDVRGQVVTTSSVHPGEIGEIIALGSGLSKRFFHVRFQDGATEWFSEDQVFAEDPHP